MSTAPQPQRPVVIYQSGGRFFSRLGWIGFVVCLVLLMRLYAAKESYYDTSGGVKEKFHSGEKDGTNKVAILSIKGLIVGGEGFVQQQIKKIRDDKKVKAVVIRVDSPGGTVTGSDYIYHHLKKLKEERKIPLVVSMGSIATSGGYYVSMAVGDEEDSIFAEPTTTTGSIGVIVPHYDISGLLEKHNIEDDSIASHSRKQMLAMTRKMPEDHRAIVQQHVDEAFLRFKKIVKAGRPRFRDGSDDLKKGEIDLATGEIFWGEQAKEYGLVDKIGFLEDAIERAIELADLSKRNTRIIRYENPASLFELPMLMSSKRSDPFGLATLLEFSTPRAFYVATTLPPLVRGE